jgi:lipoprotein NlpI
MLSNFVNREYLSSSVVFILYNLGKIDDAKLYHENGNYKNDNENDNLIFEIDPTTEEAATNAAITYYSLGFILKHDKELEDEFIQWQSYVIAYM